MDDYVIYYLNYANEYVKIATFYNEEDAKLFVKAYETEYPEIIVEVTKTEYDERTIYNSRDYKRLTED